jgi:ppGpp synthetase/RelA/SpoT-type nucleotidyltranferase
MENFDRDYEALVGPLQDFKVSIDSLIKTLLEIEGIRVHSVTSRIKSKASVRQKLQRPDKDRKLSGLTDMLGVRIITYFQDEVDAAAKLIEREFIVDEENSSDKRELLDPDRFGYRSLHYVLQLSLERSTLPENRAHRDIRFELQIRSILQHAWAEIEHDTGYKSESEVPDAVRRRFSRLAGLLELADDEFLGIRDELAKSANLRRSPTEDVQPEVERILARPALIALPDWDKRWTEREYVTYAAASDPRLVLLDRVLLEIPSSHGRFEPCDLLGPDDELIHVANPRHSASFGHLFNQALVSTEILLDSADARQALVGAVKDHGRGRTLASGFYPREVVLAFPSKDGPAVPIQRIPPFSHFTLSRVAEALEERNITLRITGIREF